MSDLLTLGKAMRMAEKPRSLNHTGSETQIEISYGNDADRRMLSISFLRNDDIALHAGHISSAFYALRFRNVFGGTLSPCTYNALRLLAYAMTLQQDPSALTGEMGTKAGAENIKWLTAVQDENLVNYTSTLRQLYRFHDDHDGYFHGHLRLSLASTKRGKTMRIFSAPSEHSGSEEKGYREYLRSCCRSDMTLASYVIKEPGEESSVGDKMIWNALTILAIAMRLDREAYPGRTLGEIRKR